MTAPLLCRYCGGLIGDADPFFCSEQCIFDFAYRVAKHSPTKAYIEALGQQQAGRAAKARERAARLKAGAPRQHVAVTSK